MTVDLDEMGPVAAKSYPGQQLVRARPEPAQDAPAPVKPAERATQAIDDGRRGKGYVYGAFQAATGEAFTVTYPRRTAADFADLLEPVDAWIDPAVERVYAILDKLSAHRATDVLLFNLAHPRWACVCQPKAAASLNRIEPWWQLLRSLALKGRRFETWAEVCAAIERATADGNAQKHPFVWGRRRRHQPRRRPGIARVAKAA